jgi:hypothetical protein
MAHSSRLEPRRLAALVLAAMSVHVLAAAPARAGSKPNCRDLIFAGAAGAASNDKVKIRVVDNAGSEADRSCQLQVHNNETAHAFAARLVGSWGAGDGVTCPELNPPPKKTCGTGSNAKSCNHVFKFKPDKTTLDPDDGLIRVRICCFDSPTGCKGAKLLATPVSVQTLVDPAVTFTPTVPPPAGITITPVALDPIGMTQLPFSTQQSCRTALGKAFGKLTTVAAETLVDCQRQALAGVLPPGVDCNTPNPVSDPGQKIEAAAAAVRQVATATCAAAGAPAAFGFQDGVCPCPCQSLGGTPGWPFVGDCIVCRVEHAVTDLMAAVYGPAGSASNPPPPGSCVDTVAKDLVGLVRTHTAETVGCQRLVDAGSLALPSGTSCRDADPKGRRAAAEQSVATQVTSACQPTGLPPSPPCLGQPDPAPCLLLNARQAAGRATDAIFPEHALPPCSPGGAFLDGSLG